MRFGMPPLRTQASFPAAAVRRPPYHLQVPIGSRGEVWPMPRRDFSRVVRNHSLSSPGERKCDLLTAAERRVDHRPMRPSALTETGMLDVETPSTFPCRPCTSLGCTALADARRTPQVISSFSGRSGFY